ncbi:MAG: hypothetical protein U1C33_08100, partial [Candidatus Cloacimonadaceae bacterium]|nr:hypothetical protein [Candidatus Cloacimonadaceae bacterium]
MTEGEDFYEAKWNEAEFAHIIAGARTDKAPIIAYGRGLSEHYHNYYQMNALATRNLSTDYTILKDIYISMGWVWSEVSSGGQIHYIKASPPYVFCNREEFLARNTNSNYLEKNMDYSSEWQELMDGQVLTRSYVYVENSHLIPFISYSYGCTPTSGAMLNEYYKNNSPNVEGHYTKLVNNYFRRWDSISERTRYHVSDAHRDIAEQMMTDTDIWGMTLPWVVATGMGYYYISRGHGNWGDVYSWYWNYSWSNIEMFNDLKYEINQNTPALMNTWNHTICAIGYENASRMVALHDPNTHYVRYWHISDFWYLMKIHPRPRADGEFVNLISPDGGQDWSGNGTGETVKQNSVFEIRWEGDLTSNSLVDIYYSTHPDFPLINMQNIAFNQPNTGYYPWLVPSYLECESVRIMIIVKNAQSEYLGYDCSWGQFSVTTGGSVTQISNGMQYSVNGSPLYCRIDTPNNVPAWGVVGIRKNTSASSTMDIWNQRFSSRKTTSTQSDKLNWVVFDKNHAPDTQLGIRVAVQPEDIGHIIHFEGGDHHLSSGTYNLVLNTGVFVRDYDVQLQPGLYTFSLNHTSGFG